MKRNLLLLSFILTLFTAKSQVNIIPDTIYPVGIITPDVDVNEPISFPLQNPIIIGDINGDNLVDFAFNSMHVSDERTQDLTDYVTKSLIVTDINNPSSGELLYNSTISAIGDYNGDAYSDMIDLGKKTIYFGNSSGNNFDSITIYLPDNDYFKIVFHNDINNDGKSDFIVADNYVDSLFIFSDLSENPYVINISYSNGNYTNCSLIEYVDYDNDGNKELCIINTDSYYNRYIFNWYRYDENTDEFIFLENTNRVYLNEPISSFISGLCDMNGDGFMDICHTFYNSETGFQIEYMCGNTDDSKYFGSPKTVETGIFSRLLYIAGDINNDGYSDWYSKSAPDTVVILYGNPDLDSIGFTISKIPIDTSTFILPRGASYSYYLCDMPVVFDYNNDNFDDLLFNYWSYDQHLRYDTIATAIYCGETNLDFTNPLLISLPIEESIQQQGFGEKIKNIGDINNDGYEDWAIIAKYSSYVNIYFGGSIIDFEPDIKILLPQDSKAVSHDMAVGDINNDGVMDIIASSSSNSDARLGGSIIGNRQSVFVFLGKPDMPSTLTILDADYTLSNNNNFYEFGRNIGIVGDYNADGYNDFVIGGLTREAYIYLGGVSLSTEPDMVINVTGSSIYYFANPITSCGDFNNDGYDDFILGDSGKGTGQSLIYFGGPDADIYYDFRFVNPDSTTNKFGEIATITRGDFTSNGDPDIALCHYQTQKIYVYEGGESIDNIPDLILQDTSLISQMSCIRYLHNFSEKNLSDIIIGNITPFIFYNSSENKSVADLVLKNDLWRLSDIASGDFNNDEYLDIFIGNSYIPSYGYYYGGVVQHFISPIMVSTEDIKETTSCLKIYPIPAKDYFNIRVNTQKDQNCNLAIHDISGRIIKKCSIKSNTVEVVNIEGIKDGVYLISLNAGNSTFREKIVVRN